MMKMKVNEVYGVSNQMIETYIERSKVDGLFLDGLSRNKHIIVYGASKQGKTSLVNKHLKEDDYVKVNCSTDTDVIDIYKSIIRQLGIEMLSSPELSHSIMKGILNFIFNPPDTLPSIELVSS